MTQPDGAIAVQSTESPPRVPILAMVLGWISANGVGALAFALYTVTAFVVFGNIRTELGVLNEVLSSFLTMFFLGLVFGLPITALPSLAVRATLGRQPIGFIPACIWGVVFGSLLAGLLGSASPGEERYQGALVFFLIGPIAGAAWAVVERASVKP